MAMSHFSSKFLSDDFTIYIDLELVTLFKMIHYQACDITIEYVLVIILPLTSFLDSSLLID